MGKESVNHETMYQKYIEIISTFLRKKVYPSISSKSDQELLIEIWKRWENYNGVMLKLLRNFFSYLVPFFE